MWARLITVGIGLWLMVLPAIYQMPKNWANHAHIVGPIIMSIGLVATSEATRNIRYVNTVMGVWLLAAPWLLHHNDTRIILNELIAGLLLIGFSLVKGKVENRFGGGWTSLWAESPDHVRATQSIDKN